MWGVNVSGVCFCNKQDRLIKRLKYAEIEKPKDLLSDTYKEQSLARLLSGHDGPEEHAEDAEDLPAAKRQHTGPAEHSSPRNVRTGTEDKPCTTPEPKVKASSPIGISFEDLDDAEIDWGNLDDEELTTAPTTVETQARPKPSTCQLLAQALR